MEGFNNHGREINPDGVGMFLQATNQVIILLIAAAAALLILPSRWLILVTFLNVFTSEMPARAASTRRFFRRINEWWYGIPVVPVRFFKPEADSGNK
jgi:hypothetical protein